MSDVPVPATQWLASDEQAVWRALLAVHARLVDRLDAELLAGHRLSLGDYDLLVQLSESPTRSRRMAELASRLALSPSGLTRRVDGLVRRGLVTRQACPDDGRGSLAVLTEVGAQAMDEAAPTHVAGVRRYIFDPLTPASVGGMARGLEALAAALDAGEPDRNRRHPMTGVTGPVESAPVAGHPVSSGTSR